MDGIVLNRLWQNKAFRRDLFIVLAIGTVLALISPFGATSHLPLHWAWFYWVGLLGWGWLVAHFLGPWLQRRLHFLPELPLYLVISVIMAVVVMPMILLVQYLGGHPISQAYWPKLYLLVWVISLAVTGIAWLSNRAFSKPQARPDGSAFLVRIPARISAGDLLAVSSEDHYLRIHTSEGSDLVLMRLSDAISELDGYDGMQVHRSWWVARAGVSDFRRDGSKIMLTLRDDPQTEVPVSRSFAKHVREAGWLG